MVSETRHDAQTQPGGEDDTTPLPAHATDGTTAGRTTRHQAHMPPDQPTGTEGGGPRRAAPAQPGRAPAEGAIRLQRGQMLSFGSAADNDIVLPLPGVAPHIARVARNAADEYTIMALDSAGGVFVDGNAVQHAELAQGAGVRIGRYAYHLMSNALIPCVADGGIQIDVVDLRETVHAGPLLGGHTRTLLDNISLTIPPGAFVALVGASGAGKTTLLNALSGQRPAQQGFVLYNGQDLYDHPEAFSGTCGFVPQDDIIHGNLPVGRALQYAARMRLPRSMSRQQVRARVREVLEEIEMLPQRRQLISQLSGGERKRVNIAVELLGHPSIFFLDEPTTGLDPGLDLKLMQLLRRLADRGCTVVLATHETRDIDTCDFACFLARDGRLAYYGPPDHVKRHFDMTHYADIYNALDSDPEAWVTRYRQSQDYLTYIASPGARAQRRLRVGVAPQTTISAAPRKAHPVRQFLLLSERYAELLLRDRVNLLILLAQAPIIALLIVLLARHQVLHLAANPQLETSPQDYYAQRELFIMATTAVWFGTINAAREIVKEAPIYRRERAIALRIVPYACSKLLVLGTLAAVQCFVLLYIVGLKTGYPNHGLFLPGIRGAFAELYVSLLLMALVGLGMGLVVSALVPNTDRAVSIVPLLLIPQIIFANVIFTLHGVGQYVSWLIPTRWGMQAMGSIAALHDKYTGQAQQPFYTMDRLHVLGFWGALLLQAIILYLCVWYVLRRKDGLTHGRSPGSTPRSAPR